MNTKMKVLLWIGLGICFFICFPVLSVFLFIGFLGFLVGKTNFFDIVVEVWKEASARVEKRKKKKEA